MYTLVGIPFTRTFRAVWCMEELGAAYEINPAMPQSPEIRVLSPSGKVPALLVDDQVITDSIAICQFLVDRHGDDTTMPNYPLGSVERAQIQSWIYFIQDELESPLWVYWKHTKVRPEEYQVQAIKPVAAKEHKKGLRILDKRFGEGPYLMGEDFTVADILLTHCADWAKMVGFDPASDRLNDYFDRCRARPAYKQAEAIRAKK